MLSGILKQIIENNPEASFNVVTRTAISQILQGHPAIEEIGHPPPDAHIVGTAWWNHEDFGKPNKRAYQILAEMLGLKTPIEERLYVPWKSEDDPILMKNLPLKELNVMICPASDSPRKDMHPLNWEKLVEKLNQDNINVVQVGNRQEPYIRGAFNLLGLTSLKDSIALIRHFDAVITSHNFYMHAAYLSNVPTVVLWGPTDHQIFGYAGQIHLQAKPTCEYIEDCKRPKHRYLHDRMCPNKDEHCMSQHKIETIYRAVHGLLDKKGFSSV